MAKHRNHERDQRRLYDDLAWTWPIISPPADYVDEARYIRHLIEESSQIPARTLLHLGCGGGHYDLTLKEYYQVTGVDLSPAMLDLAWRLNPEVDYEIGDMRKIRLEGTYDAVFIGDSIDYMLTGEELVDSFETAYLHLKPGGVFITYAEMMLERFIQNDTRIISGVAGDISIVFIENYFRSPQADTIFEAIFIFLIRQKGKLTVETDRHLGGLFPRELWYKSLADTGFQVSERQFITDQIPILICQKPLRVEEGAS